MVDIPDNNNGNVHVLQLGCTDALIRHILECWEH
jgi:hypothetical protein